MEERFNRIRESEKLPDFKLAIVVHRHGPKSGLAGSLSEEGIEQTEEYFRDAYEGIELDELDLDGVDIEYSPIYRTKQTSEIYADVMRKYRAKVRSSHEDERLSEGSIAEHPEIIAAYGQTQTEWIKGWLRDNDRRDKNVKTGKEAVKGFASWLLEKIQHRKQDGGSQEIDAFSHGPLMIGFLIVLQEKLNQSILPQNWEDKKIFDGIMGYLNYFNFFIDSKRPDVVMFQFKGVNYEVPLNIIEELAS
jgi:hypothetical protein